MNNTLFAGGTQTSSHVNLEGLEIFCSYLGPDHRNSDSRRSVFGLRIPISPWSLGDAHAVRPDAGCLSQEPATCMHFLAWPGLCVPAELQDMTNLNIWTWLCFLKRVFSFQQNVTYEERY